MNKPSPLTIAVVMAIAILLLLWAFQDTDFDSLWQAILRVGILGIIALCLVHGLGFIFDIAAWQCNFPPHFAQPTLLWFKRLGLANFVGEGVNALSPFGSVSGEPVKAWLLNKRYAVSWQDGSSTLLLHQVMIILAEGLFLLFCIMLALTLPEATSYIRSFLIFAGIVILLLLGLLLLGLYRSGLKFLARGLSRLHPHALLQKTAGFLLDIDQQLSHQVKTYPGRFTIALLNNLTVWGMGACETWLALNLMGLEASLAIACTIEGAIVLTRSMTFFIPGHLGAQEAAMVWLASATGLGPEAGLALALLRRARELIWSVPGLLLGLHFGLRSARLKPEAP